MNAYEAPINTHRPTHAKSLAESIASALAPRRRIPYGLTALFILCLAHAPQATAQFTTVINVPPDVAPSEIGSDTQLNVLDGGTLPSDFFSPFQAGLPDGSSSNIEINISGGSVGQFFDANSSSHVTISGGTVSSSFNANSGSEVTIAGGSMGPYFDANTGSLVTIFGGSVGLNFDANSGSLVTLAGGTVGSFAAHSGSQVTISGGLVRRGFRALPDSQVALSGGEFLVNGAAPLESTVTLSSSDVLTGTLEDGSPFVFSPLIGDDINGVTLSRAPLPALDTNPIVIDSETTARGLRGGQTLTLVENGVLGEDFTAVNAALNIEGGEARQRMKVAGSQVTISGGSVGIDFAALAGSHVTVSGGSVGHYFNANSGSQVTISGGSVGVGFDANSGSQVNISGGSVGNTFSALGGSQVTVSGGAVGASFRVHPGSRVTVSGGVLGRNLRAEQGSEVTISGGDFLLNGAPPTGSSVTLSDSDVLTGVVEDGTPFVFYGGGDRLEGVTLASVPLPAADTMPIIVDSEDAPTGLRAGQTLTLLQNGVLGDHFAAVNAALDIRGGQVGMGLEVVDSQVAISGGAVDSSFTAGVGSEVTISGGSVGDYSNFLSGSKLTMSGGTVGSFLAAGRGSQIHIVGSRFRLNALPITGLTNPGDSLVLDARGRQFLYGTLADGTPFDFVLNELYRRGTDFFDFDAVLRLTLVLAGDYNSDGVVDARDYAVWRDNLGAEAGTLPNDVDGGPIGAAQYATWRANYGASTQPGAIDSGSVPEPTALVLLLLGAARVCGQRSVRK